MDLVTKIAADATVSLVTEVFKSTLQGLSVTKDWMNEKIAKTDPFGCAAKKYDEQIEKNHNNMRIFGMEKPIPLRGIYVRINILDKISSHRRESLKDLQNKYADSKLPNYDFYTPRSDEERIESYDFSNSKNKNNAENAIDVINRISKLFFLFIPLTRWNVANSVRIS